MLRVPIENVSEKMVLARGVPDPTGPEQNLFKPASRQCVTISDGQDAVVMHMDADMPCQPVVRPIDVKLATQPKPDDDDDTRDINLAGHSNLQITHISVFDVTPYIYNA